MKNSNGNWVDGNGIVYTFGQYGVTDNYGNIIHMTTAEIITATTEITATMEIMATMGTMVIPVETQVETQEVIPAAAPTGFYDDQGNYISVTQDANGNWVDSGGMQYTFGNDGVTDANGNFYPY